MKILIHGRKNGYIVLYPKPTPTEFYSFASDIQSISANNYAVYYGKNIYTLAFVNGGCIFTKYVIGNDVERGQLGEIGISVFIPNTYKLKGEDVKTLLDELINTYTRNYISDNKIIEPKNGFDWLLFTSLANGYDQELLPRSSNDDNFTLGTKDPAFHYYKSDSELIEHFDKPFQEEYSDYRQILFIDSNLKGDGNPLYVLRNSGVELNPDLKNEHYYLINYNRSKGVKITAYYNNKWHERSDGKGNNKIRAKWPVEIKYSKDDRCYEPINAPGTISNLSSEIHKYVKINGNQIILQYDAFINLKKKTKRVVFKITDRKEVDFSDAEITCENNNDQTVKTVINNQLVFSDEELKDSWSVIARKGDYSGKTEFTPVETNESDPVRIRVEKKTIITINVKDEKEENLFDFEVCTKLTNGFKRGNTIEFVDEQIMDSYHVTIRKRGYKEENIPDFQPYKVNSIIVTLQKKPETTQNYSEQPSTQKKPEKQESYGTKERKTIPKPVVIVASIVIVLGIGFGVWYLWNIFGDDKQPAKNTLNKWNIERYVEGDSLFLETLYDYKENWKLQERNFITESGSGIFGGEENADYEKWYSDWKPVYESIERSITKRTFINEKNFSELKYLRYSAVQKPFITAINKTDSTEYAEVGEELGDVSALTLTQIANSIDVILAQKEQEIQRQPLEPKKGERETSSKNKKSRKTEQTKEQPKPKENKNAAPPAQQESVLSRKTSEIIQYIKGSELDKAKLKEYLNTKGINQNLKNSIQLSLDFWDLDGNVIGKKSRTYWTFQEKVNADVNFNNSKLKAFLDKVCQEKYPSYSEQDKNRGLRIK